jgi:hypothetical protein
MTIAKPLLSDLAFSFAGDAFFLLFTRWPTKRSWTMSVDRLANTAIRNGYGLVGLLPQRKSHRSSRESTAGYISVVPGEPGS